MVGRRVLADLVDGSDRQPRARGSSCARRSVIGRRGDSGARDPASGSQESATWIRPSREAGPPSLTRMSPARDKRGSNVKAARAAANVSAAHTNEPSAPTRPLGMQFALRSASAADEQGLDRTTSRARTDISRSAPVNATVPRLSGRGRCGLPVAQRHAIAFASAQEHALRGPGPVGVRGRQGGGRLRRGWRKKAGSLRRGVTRSQRPPVRAGRRGDRGSPPHRGPALKTLLEPAPSGRLIADVLRASEDGWHCRTLHAQLRPGGHHGTLGADSRSGPWIRIWDGYRASGVSLLRRRP